MEPADLFPSLRFVKRNGQCLPGRVGIFLRPCRETPRWRELSINNAGRLVTYRLGRIPNKIDPKREVLAARGQCPTTVGADASCQRMNGGKFGDDRPCFDVANECALP